MENTAIYLLKASALLALFYLVYYIFLRKETFFTGNRWFLLSGLFISLVCPFIIYTKVIWVTPDYATSALPLYIAEQATPQNSTIVTHQPTVNINWQQVITSLYILGLALFTIQFIYNIAKVILIIRKHPFTRHGQFRIIDGAGISQPFSFFRHIAFNSSGLNPAELQNIINHEKVHSRQWHSLDLIICQLFCIVFWFNPFIWLYKKAIIQNLEFIADKSAITNSDKIHYQKTLLKFTVKQHGFAITNHFYQSLIKKRIIMLNKNHSPRTNTLRYAVIIPALCAFVYFFQIQTVARTRNTDVNTTGKHLYNQAVIITKDDTNTHLKNKAATLRKQYNADIEFSNVERNLSGEITSINIVYNNTDKIENRINHNVALNGKAIESFTITAIKNKYGKADIIIKRSTAEENRRINYMQPDSTFTVKGIMKGEDTNAENGNNRIVYNPSKNLMRVGAFTLKQSAELTGADYKKAYIVIDDKESGLEELNKIKDADITESVVSVDESYIAKYGDKARYGVVTVRTVGKGNVTLNKAANTRWMMDIINKTSTDNEIKEKAAFLTQKGFRVTYTKPERNSQGNITGIKITVKDLATNVSCSGTWDSNSNADGIPDIMFGQQGLRLMVIPQY